MSGRISSDHSRSESHSSQLPQPSQSQHESLPGHSIGRSSRASNPNVFSDEYSLDPIDPDQIDRAPSPDSISSATTLRSTNPVPKNVPTTAAAAAAATAENDNPFADDARASFDEPHRSSLPQKGGGFATDRNSVSSINNAQFAMQRNHSVSSRFSTPRAMSPYTGATGPSHPYAMYSQVGVSRTPSVGSTSTIRPAERPLGELSGPQHPYAMYTQNVVEEGMDDDQIPVGFPGHNLAYQPRPDRRIDDVGDIIGPDGHTEPLPPYSRYPTGVVPKPPGAEDATDVPASPPEEQQLHSTSREAVPVPPVPVSETSSRALVPDNTGTSERENDGEQAAPTSGIMAFEEKVKQKGKQTACCGLPVWTLVLVATVMLIGGSIGGAIGGVLGTKKAQEAEHQSEAASHKPGPDIVTVTATPQLDYSAITSTPTNIQAAPTGHYLIPAVLRNYSRFCVDDHDIKQVWSCVEKPSDFEIKLEESDGQKSIIFDYSTPTSTYTYGAQQPYLPTPTQNLSMAFDTSEAGLGPALFFFALFNKLVILPEDTFTSSSISSRDLSERELSDPYADAFLDRTTVAKPGDKPWFCWWNSTLMEFFLYVNQSTVDQFPSTETAVTGGDLAASTATAQPYAKRSDPIANYPRKIKIEERRDYAEAESPYCQQMQVDKNGNLDPIPQSIVQIKEIEPAPTTTYFPTALGAGQTYTAKAQYATPCYCLSSSD
ncbi:hypothetical protein N7468_004432 [Penicillium chermesinum]|uniref:DUF7820 domain-containing protein n=1 Tax=Penicillium chermesinum TaxID=63820 RepID=A0A9W9TT67_9EURO|nr:uncharacterized protein N7468_004432 [Penicillium chermesinum]KAJ5239813.1 hypothetical protein N7468_004432 [Penicillium chermesinum]